MDEHEEAIRKLEEVLRNIDWSKEEKVHYCPLWHDGCGDCDGQFYAEGVCFNG